MTEKKISFEGFNYTYKYLKNIKANHVPVMFVSGAFQNMNTWKRFAKSFENTADVILSDLPGIGDAELLPHTYSFQFLAKAILNLLDHLEVEKVFLVAASYGTPIAYIFSGLYPERVDKLLLNGIRYRFTDQVNATLNQQVERLTAKDLTTFKEDCISNLLNYAEKDNISRFKLAERVLGASIENMTEGDFARYIENTKRVLLYQGEFSNCTPPTCNTLILTGEYDSLSPPGEAKKIAENIKNSQLVIVEKADHILHLERYKTVSKIVKDFYLKKI